MATPTHDTATMCAAVEPSTSLLRPSPRVTYHLLTSSHNKRRPFLHTQYKLLAQQVAIGYTPLTLSKLASQHIHLYMYILVCVDLTAFLLAMVFFKASHGS